MTSFKTATHPGRVSKSVALRDFRRLPARVEEDDSGSRRVLRGRGRTVRLAALLAALSLGLTAAAGAQTSGKLQVSAKVVRAESGGEVAAQVRRAARDSTGSSRVNVGVARVATVPERAARRRVVVVSFLRN